MRFQSQNPVHVFAAFRAVCGNGVTGQHEDRRQFRARITRTEILHGGHDRGRFAVLATVLISTVPAVHWLPGNV